MTNSTKYYIWLTLALGYRSTRFKALRAKYEDIGKLYNGGGSAWRLTGLLTGKNISSMENTPLSHALAVIARCNALGISVISLDDPAYPESLAGIKDPPAVLYCKGRLPDPRSRLFIGMVGTRKATAYGRQTAHSIACSLSREGVVIVSGGAMGIDTVSHTAALESGGLTVCVMGCGLNYPYLLSNRKLRENISQRGAVISEYPPDYPPSKFTFHDRNRIISGLSRGVLVVEAGTKSGSLVTARYAAEQRRDVFAVMGNITSQYSEGTNRLIKSGAVPVTEYSDITSRYPEPGLRAEPGSLVRERPVRKTGLDISREADAVYRLITADPVHIDSIATASGMSVKAVLRSLTELELEGLIEADRGRMYKLI